MTIKELNDTMKEVLTEIRFLISETKRTRRVISIVNVVNILTLVVILVLIYRG
jgi:predicted nucleic acid-binding Zn ribbon protein